MGHVHAWIHDKDEAPIRIAKYNWHLEGRESDAYIQSECDIRALENLMKAEDIVELNKGWHAFFTEETDPTIFDALCEICGVVECEDPAKTAKANEISFKRVIAFISKLTEILHGNKYFVAFNKDHVQRLRVIHVSYNIRDPLPTMEMLSRSLSFERKSYLSTVKFGLTQGPDIQTTKELLNQALLTHETICEDYPYFVFEDIQGAQHTLHIYPFKQEELFVTDAMNMRKIMNG